MKAGVVASMIMAVLGLIPRRSAWPSTPSRPMPVESKGVDTRTECAHDEAAMPVRHAQALARPSAPPRPIPVECKGVDTRTECAHDEAAMPVRHGRPRACPEEIGPPSMSFCAVAKGKAWMTGPSPVMTKWKGDSVMAGHRPGHPRLHTMPSERKAWMTGLILGTGPSPVMTTMRGHSSARGVEC